VAAERATQLQLHRLKKAVGSSPNDGETDDLATPWLGARSALTRARAMSTELPADLFSSAGAIVVVPLANLRDQSRTTP